MKQEDQDMIDRIEASPARPPFVSVIVLAHNNIASIESCLIAILSSRYPLFEVIVVDNFSTDGTREILTGHLKKDTRLRVILNSSNVGAAEGRNIAMDVAKGDLIAFIDSDAIPDPEWMSQPVQAFLSQPDVGEVQSRIVSADGWSYNGWVSSQRLLGVPSNVNGLTEIPLATGPSIFYRNLDLHSLTRDTLFDPWYFIYHEETDFSWLVRLKGWKVLYAPNSVVWHPKQLFPRRSRQILTHMEKNLMATIFKNYPFVDLVRVTPSVIAYLVQGVALSLTEKNPNRILSNFRAYYLVLRNLRYLALERSRRQLDRRVSTATLKGLEAQTFSLRSLFNLWRQRRLYAR